MEHSEPPETQVALLLCMHAQQQSSLAAVRAAVSSAKSEADRLEDQMLANNFVLATTAVDCLTVHRQVQSFARHERWFEDTLPNMPEYFFKQAFRVRPATFRYLVDVCRPYMERQVTCMRETIAMEKRVGVALFKLCSTAEDRTVATLFGIGRSTVNELYREFCETIVAVLEPEWVKLMTPKELPEHIREFQAALEFPQGVGALDGCHFPVSPPQENASDYHNYKGWYSIILLALVDHRYRFRYVNVGAPGRCHDAHVFRRSELAKVLEGPLFRAPLVTVNGAVVPPLILCDQAFPLTSNLLKPYPRKGLKDSSPEASFNKQLSGARRIVENAFGRVKARFRCIMKRMECHVDNARVIIRACCVLNNICEHFNDGVEPQWVTEVQLYDRMFLQPFCRTDVAAGNGQDVRAAIAAYLHRRNTQQHAT
ncbi:protein ALP1-like [Ixodes scapularis]|uniref:protein ALP1-like n=1 Tax=Ixodes scapularis TaxID=6945 RepID=UPI001C392B1A|nr:protein ALP1-like [Ixodes scapularis]